MVVALQYSSVSFLSCPQEMEVLVPTSCVEEQQPAEESKEAEVAMETVPPGVCVIRSYFRCALIRIAPSQCPRRPSQVGSRERVSRQKMRGGPRDPEMMDTTETGGTEVCACTPGGEGDEPLLTAI